MIHSEKQLVFLLRVFSYSYSNLQMFVFGMVKLFIIMVTTRCQNVLPTQDINNDCDSDHEDLLELLDEL